MKTKKRVEKTCCFCDASIVNGAYITVVDGEEKRVCIRCKYAKEASRKQTPAEWLQQQITATVDDWFTRQMRNEWSAMYLWFLQSSETEYGAIAVFEDGANIPDGWILAAPQRISPAWTREKASAFITDVTRRLPLFHWGKDASR